MVEHIKFLKTGEISIEIWRWDKLNQKELPIYDKASAMK